MSKKRTALFPIEYDEISLVDEGAAGSANVLIMKRAKVEKRRPIVPDKGKKGGGRNLENPCSTSSSSTGAKDGKSKRSKNWDETKHPRDEKGRMKETSSESKAKNGKGGTTKSKLERACREKKKGGKGKKISEITSDPETRRKIRNRREKRRKERRSTPVGKSAMSTWDSDAHIRALLERKS